MWIQSEPVRSTRTPTTRADRPGPTARKAPGLRPVLGVQGPICVCGIEWGTHRPPASGVKRGSAALGCACGGSVMVLPICDICRCRLLWPSLALWRTCAHTVHTHTSQAPTCLLVSLVQGVTGDDVEWREKQMRGGKQNAKTKGSMLVSEHVLLLHNLRRRHSGEQGTCSRTAVKAVFHWN